MNDDHNKQLKQLRDEQREREDEQYEYNQRLKRERQRAERADEQHLKYSTIASHLFSYVVLVAMTILFIYLTIEYIRSKANELIAKLPSLPGSADHTPNIIGVTRSTAGTWASVHIGVIIVLLFCTFFVPKETEEKTIWGKISGFFSLGKIINRVLQYAVDILLVVLCLLGPIFSLSGLYDGAAPSLLVALNVVSVCQFLRTSIHSWREHVKERTKVLNDGDVLVKQAVELEDHARRLTVQIRKGPPGRNSELIKRRDEIKRVAAALRDYTRVLLADGSTAIEKTAAIALSESDETKQLVSDAKSSKPWLEWLSGGRTWMDMR